MAMLQYILGMPLPIIGVDCYKVNVASVVHELAFVEGRAFLYLLVQLVLVLLHEKLEFLVNQGRLILLRKIRILLAYGCGNLIADVSKDCLP